jgi:hypothetical protein
MELNMFMLVLTKQLIEDQNNLIDIYTKRL